MKATATFAGLSLSALMLTGCIVVDDDGHSGRDSIARNTDAAIRVCGEGNVQKVDEDGYSCKEDD